MATFGALKTQASARIQDRLNTSVPASEVGDAINAAIRYWKNKIFWFNQVNQDVTLNTGDPVIPGVSALVIDSIRLLDNNYTYDLEVWDNRYYDAQNLFGRGRPYAYTWRDGRYETYWYPDRAYQLKISGTKDYSDLVNDSETNDFTVYADQLILYDALSRLTAELRTDPTISDYYATRRQDEFNNLNARTNQTIGTGRATVYF